MGMRNGHYHERITVDTVYHSVRESCQATPANGWRNFWMR